MSTFSLGTADDAAAAAHTPVKLVTSKTSKAASSQLNLSSINVEKENLPRPNESFRPQKACIQAPDCSFFKLPSEPLGHKIGLITIHYQPEPISLPLHSSMLDVEPS